METSKNILLFLLILNSFTSNIFSKDVNSQNSYANRSLPNLETKNYKISVIGSGYVGLVAGAGLAYFGNSVVCADIDNSKVELLNQGEIPIYEPKLKELISEQIKLDRLKFTSQVEDAIRSSDIIFIAVGTPMDDTGRTDLSYIEAVAKAIGKNLNGYKIICTKSTVPVNTGQLIKDLISLESEDKFEFDVVSNPEFLKEGDAVNDFLNPDRVVLGVETEKAKEILNDIYRPLIERDIPFIYTSLNTAETIKYVANSFLATKISFINEVANFCEKVNADVLVVAKGIGLDKRIGQYFLNPGPGFGGSCFPKDTHSFLHKANQNGLNLQIVEAALKVNAQQRKHVFEKISNLLEGELEGKTIAILGLAFKAETDDIRESPAIYLIKEFLASKANIKAYDPMASNNMKHLYPDITYASSSADALSGADIAVILTEWKEFKELDLSKAASTMKNKVLFDARNILKVNELKDLGFKFANIGLAQVK